MVIRMPTDLPPSFHVVAILFLFALGACCGSFLNVVVLRVPRTEVPEDASLWRNFWLQLRGVSHPPSHCPRCNYELKWYDNVPIVGWLWLGGKCRNCRLPISPRYPIVELTTAVLFAGLYACFFLAGPAWGPPTPTVEATVALAPDVQGPQLMLGDESREALASAVQASLPTDVGERYEVVDAEYLGAGGGGIAGSRTTLAWLRSRAFVAEHWPMLVIALVLTWCLLAGSLIDAEHYIIPRFFSYFPAIVGITLHAIYDEPGAPLSVMAGPVGCAWAIGGGVGLLVAIGLVWFGLLRRSFELGVPADVVDVTVEPSRGETMREMVRELAFLALPFGLGLIAALLAIGPLAELFNGVAANRAISAGLGALRGGLIGGGVIWVIRLFGSFIFGREAMGLGDVDLMFGVGCCIGAAPAGLAVFPAAVIGLVFAFGKLFSERWKEIPFGPYLAAASVLFLVTFNHVADYLRPALSGLGFLLGPVAPLLGLA